MNLSLGYDYSHFPWRMWGRGRAISNPVKNRSGAEPPGFNSKPCRESGWGLLAALTPGSRRERFSSRRTSGKAVRGVPCCARAQAQRELGTSLGDSLGGSMKSPTETDAPAFEQELLASIEVQHRFALRLARADRISASRLAFLVIER